MPEPSPRAPIHTLRSESQAPPESLITARRVRAPMATIAPGDLVALADEEGGRTLGGAQKLRGVGILAGERLVGLAWGDVLTHGSKTLRLLKPGVADLTAGLARKAQIVLPKDASRILFECDVRAGSRVVEAGIGSGALTTALAWAVAPTGRVFTYEIRPDFIDWARRNLEESGLAPLVEVKEGDITKGVQERDVDAVVLDVPNPWDAVPAAREALRGDGHFCAYSPLVSQVELTHKALREHGFHDLRTLEIIERRWTVGERGSRPDHEMLGHTAWLTFARKGV